MCLCLILVMMAGCAASEAIVEPVVEPSATPNTDLMDWMSAGGVNFVDAPKYRTWFGPTKPLVENYYPGAVAEIWLTLHYYDPATISYFVTTEQDENGCPLLLPRGLALGKVNEVLAIVSDNPNDKPRTIGYDSDTKEVIVDGLLSETTRKITVSYESPATFIVAYKEPIKIADGFSPPPQGIESWITISDPAPNLKPLETRDIMITLAMPEGAVAPDAFEFWIVARDNTQAGSVQTETCSRCFVRMRV